MQKNVEFAIVWLLVRFLGILPRAAARKIGEAVGALALRLVPRLRHVGLTNLEVAFPAMSLGERQSILRKLYRTLGWLLAEFCQMPSYTPENTRSFPRYDGLERYLSAREKG